MLAVLTCIFVEHDLRLVVVAALICVTACCTAFGFHARALRSSGVLRLAWLGMTGLVAGSGVWATHFMAMLAYQPSLRIGYDFIETAVSFAAAVVGMGVGFALPAWRRGRDMDMIGGAVTGVSVAVMHYIGIAAIRTQAAMQWDLRFVAASILIGALGGMVAFSVRHRVKGVWAFAPPAAVLVLGIVGLHFTAMTAVTLLPDAALAVPAEVMGRGGLAAATVALTLLILAAGASLLFMERLGQRNTFISLRHALNAVPSGIVFYDSADRLRTWNTAYAALMADCGVVCHAGDSRRSHIQAAAAASWFDKTDEGPATMAANMDARVRPGASEFLRPDGRWLRHEAFATEDGGGVTVLTDITEQRRTAAAMAAARDNAEAANRAKSEFLANMSHEIRTPLNGVLGIADVLMRTRLNGQQRQLVGVIQQSGGLLNGLLTELLDLARVEAGMAELRPEPVRPGELAAQVRDLFRGSADEKGLTLMLAVGPGADAEVDCDPLRMRQILGNLISNAIKFTEAGEVKLALARDGERLHFEVRDTGSGFDAGLKARLFQRFSQADGSATRRQGGAGLGLAICDEYVRLMGGELDCESVPGEGSVFSFTLELPVREAAAPAPAVEWPPGRFRVLVVDDNPVNRQVLELVLESVGVEHASVTNGAEAVEAMMTEGFDAALMDIQMPVMDGLEATRGIRAWEAEAGRPRAPILIVSANCMKEHVDAGRMAGADGHINKPIAVAELLSMLAPYMAATERDEGRLRARV